MSSSIGSIGGLGNNNYLFQMNARPMQQRQDDLFSQIDSDSSSGIDKTEFSVFAKKLSQDSGNSIDVDDVFSTYDTDGDGSLSSDEIKSFMQDNPPPPPPNGISGGPQGPDDLFAKLDGNSDSGIDKSEFSTFSEKLSEDTGNTINVDDVFSIYDTDGDGSLNTEEMKSFMKDNAPSPPPPGQMQQAASAYGTDQSSDQMSTLLDLLKNISDLVGSSANGNGSSISTYLSKVMETISNGGGSSVLNVTA